MKLQHEHIKQRDLTVSEQDRLGVLHVQGVLNTAGNDPNWDILDYPYSSCVSYKKDLSPLKVGDQVPLRPSATLCSCLQMHCFTVPHHIAFGQ